MSDNARDSPVRDPARLAAVRATELLDTPPEESFDRLARLAVRLVGVPASFVSLVDEDRDFYKAHCGFGEPLATVRQLQGTTFCHLAIAGQGPLVIPDTRADPLYRQIPTVESLGVAAYVGVPLRDRDGHALGSFCAIDFQPRAWTAAEIEVLDELARSAEREIQLRQAVREAETRTREAEALAAELSLANEEQREAVVERQRLLAMLENSPDFVGIATPQGQPLYLNPAGRALVGLDTLEQALRAPLADYFPAEDREFLREVVVPAQWRDGRWTGELRLRHFATGEPVPVLHNQFLIRHPDTGETLGVATVSRDIRPQQRAAREHQLLLEAAQAARADAEEANRSKSQFLATMSHEIRTPINAIVGYTDLLEMGIGGPLTESQKAQLARIRVSSHHLLGLINDVLDLAKVEAGQMAVEHGRAAVAGTVAGALALVRPQAAAKELAVDDACSGLGSYYVGDEGRVRQILVNLLSNAVKFTPGGGRITVECGRAETAGPPASVAGEGPWVYLRVRDTGIGIAPDQLARVFHPFVQAVGGYTRRAGGTGLGLTISRHLARLMGGDLVAESEPGRGSAFTLWLPTRPPVDEVIAREAGGPGRPRGLATIGEAMLDEIDRTLEAFRERLRADPQVPMAAGLGGADLGNHQSSLLSDFAATLIALERSTALPEQLLRDGGEIQRVIADLHGTSRARLGWTEEALRREYQVFWEELERGVRRSAPADTDVDGAVRLLHRFTERAEQITMKSLRSAGATAAA